MVKRNIPEKGDIIWLDFDPQVGHEQSGRRPAIVISPLSYNKKTGLLLACPITKNEKGYPFEVKLGENYKIKGVILSDHVKNLDWKSRNAEIIQKAEEEILNEVVNKLNVLI